jgi:beta-ketoacyl ACP synthase
VQMEGTAVFRWAPFAMAKVAHEALDLAGISVDDLDAFIPHQANLRITQTLAKNIQLPESVAVATDVVDSGNTSAASVPLAMEAMLRNDEAAVGDTALLIAFGAGLSYAGQVVTLPPLGQ